MGNNNCCGKDEQKLKPTFFDMKKVKNNIERLNKISQKQMNIEDKQDEKLKLNFTKYRHLNDIPIRERFTNVNYRQYLVNTIFKSKSVTHHLSLEWQIFGAEG